MKVLPYADPGRPDTRSPIRLLVWVGSKQLGTLGLGVAFGIAWMLSQALLPFVLGRAVDDGLAEDDRSALLLWAGALLALGAVQAVAGVMRHRVRGLELAPGVVPARPDRLSPHRERRAGGSRQPDDGRGRRDRLERRDESRRRVRHHGPAGRGDRLLRRRRRPAARVVDDSSVSSSSSASPCSSPASPS